ncbi:MAG: hypothetical protein LBT53_03010 [Puniceicoccales bacterium]|jgi:hypothetical protein|nr:hypothetical protein [Puniceicoccales bacterium]
MPNTTTQNPSPSPRRILTVAEQKNYPTIEDACLECFGREPEWQESRPKCFFHLGGGFSAWFPQYGRAGNLNLLEDEKTKIKEIFNPKWKLDFSKRIVFMRDIDRNEKYVFIGVFKTKEKTTECGITFLTHERIDDKIELPLSSR